jgi:glycosyltransferase involved in cell wall biosynthesis
MADLLTGDDQIIALTPRRVDARYDVATLVNSPKRIETAYFNWPASRQILRVAWDVLGVGIAAQRKKVDLFWGPAFSLSWWWQPSVVTIYDVAFLRQPETFTRSTLAFHRLVTTSSARRARVILTISENSRQEIVQSLKVSPQKVHVIPLGVHPRFHPLPDQSALQRAIESIWRIHVPYVLSVAKLSPRKNIPFLVRSFGAWVERYKAPYSLVLVGERGWLCEEIDQAIRESNCADRIFMLGNVSDKDLVYLYNGADVFVFPSLHEGFGLPVLEAMACGVPTLASNTSVMPETVGGAGLLFNPRDSASLISSLQEVTRDRSLRLELIRRGLQRASEFSWSKTARMTLDVFEGVVRAVAH